VFVAAPSWLIDQGAGDTSWTVLVKYYLDIEGTGRIREITKVKGAS
jgi:hypothetical protein